MPNMTLPASARVSKAAAAALEANRAGVSAILTRHALALLGCPDNRACVTDARLEDGTLLYVTTDTDGVTYIETDDEWTPPGE